ncbi:unnamed protein product [Coffea canephora]|uniref:Rad4 beta-hairpin domain-containing protein n=1 Tax=Coffea canephora TaxID=49390 RepID=A0A068U201_COFCA|nr:unnamed protein product [Coffea canephora]
MRTRSKSRQTQQPNGNGLYGYNLLSGFYLGSVEEGSTKYPGNEGKRSSVSEKFDDSGTLTNISRHAVGRLLKRVKSCGSRGLSKEDDGYLRPCDSTGMLESESEKNSKLCFNITDRVEDGYFSGNVITNTPSESGARDGLDESEWEEGSLPTDALTKSNEEQTIGGVTVEFDVTPDSVKKKSIRRATAEEKELSELVHKVNLLCLLGRGRSFDSACNDPLIQASLLSLLPARLLKITEVPKLTAKALAPLVDWFHNNFHVRGPGSTEKPPHLALASTLEAQEGTAEEVAALSVTLFRALNLTVRFVATLDVVSLKPEVDRPEYNSQVTGKDDGCLTSAGGKSRVKARKVLENSFESKDMSGVNLKDRMAEPSTSKCQDADSHACLAAKSDRPKRKGDLEFEMQLEMALSATAIENSKAIMNSDLVDVCGTNSKQFPPAKKMKVVGAEGSSVSPHGMSTAIGSRKIGAPLYWAEVYCSGENLTGKWVHVDAVNAIIDGEQKVEVAVAACRKSLRYVVAFAGNGAKDVTRRYCTRWYKIESQRINAIWWDAVLAPLKDLESRATGDCLPDSFLMNGKSKKENCEDYSVQKFAYRNHQLYAIERWLNKYQILHPKGPILGFCSGHPVYPRTCVQTLHTKERWMREGLQVKADELPAKTLKRSPKQSKEQAGEDDEIGEGDHLALFGKWQTEPLCLPHAVGGIVPKNERGQVDVWSEKCLPPGTVHLRLPRVTLVAKRLEIDFAPAMVGFEFRNGRSVPVFEGIVVCAEFKDAILEAYEEEEERRVAEEKRRNEAQALSRWYQLLSSIITRQRLNNCYGNGTSQEASVGIQKPDDTLSAEAGCKEDSRKSGGCHQDKLKDNQPTSPQSVPTEDHEHVFLLDDEMFDEESSTRTKRCKCGFSIQFEEL